MKVLSFATFTLVALAALAGADVAQERNLRSAMTNHQAVELEARKVAQQHPAMKAHHQQRQQHQAVTNHQQHQQHQAANNHHQGVMEARFQQHQAAKRPALEAHKANQQHAAMEARRQQHQAVNNNQHHQAVMEARHQHRQAANHQQQHASMESFHDKLEKAMERMRTKKNAKPALMEVKNGKNQ